MFGGEGIFVGDLMIGLVMDDQIYLKAGDSNRADFEAEGAKADYVIATCLVGPAEAA